MLKPLLRHWFLLTLVGLIFVGIGVGPRLAAMTKWHLLRDAIVATVLFCMAFPLEASTVWKTIRHPWPAVLATGINFILLPLMAWGVSLLFDQYMGAGLLVAAATPCTLASASVWTRRAGGNDAAATMVTILTNVVCFVVTPALLTLTLGQNATATAELSFGNMALKLGLLVVLPMVLAQLLRMNRKLAEWATGERALFLSFGQCGILYMVLLGAIQTGIRFQSSEPNQSESWGVILLLMATVGGLHLAALWAGIKLGAATGLSREDQIAVGFAGSQKTLMVGLKVAMEYNVSILPMVTYHIGQLLIDTVVADRMAERREENRPDNKT